jgi:hypothetical protein
LGFYILIEPLRLPSDYARLNPYKISDTIIDFNKGFWDRVYHANSKIRI